MENNVIFSLPPSLYLFFSLSWFPAPPPPPIPLPSFYRSYFLANILLCKVRSFMQQSHTHLNEKQTSLFPVGLTPENDKLTRCNKGITNYTLDEIRMIFEMAWYARCKAEAQPVLINKSSKTSALMMIHSTREINKSRRREGKISISIKMTSWNSNTMSFCFSFIASTEVDLQ